MQPNRLVLNDGFIKTGLGNFAILLNNSNMINKDKEVGGDHYSKMKIEPIELIEALDLDFIQGCIVKYVSRYKFKNGIEDLRKALHYARIRTTPGYTRPEKNVSKSEYGAINMYCESNDISAEENLIIKFASRNKFEDCYRCIGLLIDKLEEKHD